MEGSLRQGNSNSKNRIVIYFISNIAGYVLKISLSRGGERKWVQLLLFFKKCKAAENILSIHGKPWNGKNYPFPDVPFGIFCHLDTLWQCLCLKLSSLSKLRDKHWGYSQNLNMDIFCHFKFCHNKWNSSDLAYIYTTTSHSAIWPLS